VVEYQACRMLDQFTSAPRFMASNPSPVPAGSRTSTPGTPRARPAPTVSPHPASPWHRMRATSADSKRPILEPLGFRFKVPRPADWRRLRHRTDGTRDPVLFWLAMVKGGRTEVIEGGDRAVPGQLVESRLAQGSSQAVWARLGHAASAPGRF
jgi:hypothetical protein